MKGSRWIIGGAQDTNGCLSVGLLIVACSFVFVIEPGHFSCRLLVASGRFQGPGELNQRSHSDHIPLGRVALFRWDERIPRWPETVFSVS